MAQRVSILLAIPFALAFFASPPIADGKADFEAALGQVRRTMDAGRWKEAKALLSTTLDTHSGHAYVRDRLDDVRATLKACSAEIAHPRRDVKSIFCGEVASYDVKSGEIALRWKRPKDGQEAFPCGDFETGSSGSTLRVPFDGPHAIELSGKAIGQKTPVIRVCVEDERAYELALDAGSLCSIHRVDGDVRVSIASSTNSYNVLRPYTLKVAVREKQIDASHNGKRLVLGDKEKEEFGRIGFRDVLDPQTIEVRGKARRAWIEEEIDRRTAKDREEFYRTYDVNADLPEWLRGS